MLITSFAVLIVTVAVGVQERPSAAPQDGPWIPDYEVVAHPSFTAAITSVSSIVFAYSGTPSFFSIVSEMREPRMYTRSMLVCQSLVTAVYTTIGIVVYYYCGSYVASPALSSAGPLLKKVSYGFALPGLIVTLTIVTHVSFLSSHPLALKVLTSITTGACQVYFPPCYARLPSPHRKQRHTLGIMAFMYIWSYNHSLRDRQWYPRL